MRTILLPIVFTLTVLLQGCTPDVEVSYIAHASFKISYEGKTLLIDPYEDKTWIGYQFPKNITADAVLITHPHYDHDGGRFRGGHPYWEDQMEIIEEVGNYQVGDFKITGIKGKHCDPYGKEFGQKNTIWIIEVAGLRFVHLGDNGPLTQSHYEVIGQPDVLFIPIDGDYHILKPNQLKVVLNTLNPKITVPMHYRLPDLEEDGFPKGGLGNIDPYLVGKENVTILEGSTKIFNSSSISQTGEIIVFQHDIAVTK